MNTDKIESISVDVRVSKQIDVKLETRNVFHFRHFRHSSAL